MIKSGRKVLRRPLKIVTAYLLFTLFLYKFGPFQWVTYHPIQFWFLNIMYIAMFIFGWELGIRGTSRDVEWSDADGKRILSFLRVAITVEFLYELANSLRRFLITTFSFSQLIRNITLGFSDMGNAYGMLQESAEDVNYIAFGGTALTLFNLFWAFFAFNVIMLGILYFKKLSRYNKIVLIITVALIIATFIGTGTNIGVFRIVLIFIVFWGIRLSRGDSRSKFKSRRGKRRFIVGLVSAVVVVLALFDKIMQSRGGILLWQSTNYNIGGIHIRYDSLLLRLMPDGLKTLYISASNYLSQGYYGMSLSLRVPWEPGYGVGHSKVLMDMFDKTLSIPHANSYQARVTQFGWREGLQWHTMYSWFANDVTFWGVIPIMLFVGYIFALAFKDSVETNNPYAKLVTFYFSLMAFFMPCNNQLFQSTYTWFGLLTALVFWLATRGKRRFVITLGGNRV